MSQSRFEDQTEEVVRRAVESYHLHLQHLKPGEAGRQALEDVGVPKVFYEQAEQADHHERALRARRRRNAILLVPVLVIGFLGWRALLVVNEVMSGFNQMVNQQIETIQVTTDGSPLELPVLPNRTDWIEAANPDSDVELIKLAENGKWFERLNVRAMRLSTGEKPNGDHFARIDLNGPARNVRGLNTFQFRARGTGLKQVLVRFEDQSGVAWFSGPFPIEKNWKQFNVDLNHLTSESKTVDRADDLVKISFETGSGANPVSATGHFDLASAKLTR